jgi:hypothetical protein
MRFAACSAVEREFFAEHLQSLCFRAVEPQVELSLNHLASSEQIIVLSMDEL